MSVKREKKEKVGSKTENSPNFLLQFVEDNRKKFVKAIGTGPYVGVSFVVLATFGFAIRRLLKYTAKRLVTKEQKKIKIQ